jgi:hypothetical protein
MRLNVCLGNLLLLMLVGCASPPLATRIITDPPGARIEVNGNYVGPAPVDVTLPQTGNRHKLKGRAIILAFPVAPGQKLQQVVLSSKQIVPAEVRIDMTFDREAAMIPPATPPAATPPAATPPVQAPPVEVPPAEPAPPPPPPSETPPATE